MAARQRAQPFEELERFEFRLTAMKRALSQTVAGDCLWKPRDSTRWIESSRRGKRRDSLSLAPNGSESFRREPTCHPSGLRGLRSSGGRLTFRDVLANPHTLSLLFHIRVASAVRAPHHETATSATRIQLSRTHRRASDRRSSAGVFPPPS
jgi:hypothetical protein